MATSESALTAAELRAALESSREVLFGCCRELGESQWNFTETGSGNWTPLQIVEHVVVVESGVQGKLREAMRQEGAREGATQEKSSEETTRRLVLVGRRGAVRVAAPEFALPKGRFAEGPAALAAFAQVRTATLDLLAEPEQALPQLAAITLPHQSLGPMEGRQWLLFLAMHTRRHAAQIREYLRQE